MKDLGIPTIDSADVILKDEGEMLTVIFQSEQAITILKSQPEEVQNAVYGDKVKKLDIANTNKNRAMMRRFTLSHSLMVFDF